MNNDHMENGKMVTISGELSPLIVKMTQYTLASYIANVYWHTTIYMITIMWGEPSLLSSALYCIYCSIDIAPPIMNNTLCSDEFWLITSFEQFYLKHSLHSCTFHST